MVERMTKLWEAIYRWQRFHPIVLMYVASKAVRSKGSVDWIDNADRTPLAKHCASFASPNDAWAALPIGDRRDQLKNAHLPMAMATSSWDEVFLAFAKMVEDDRRDAQGPEPVEMVMVIPDELLAWADSRQLEWARPWSTEIREILQQAQPLDVGATNQLLNRLDAVVAAAVRERRVDLLVGFDLQTAELLNLAFEFDSVHGRVILGRSGFWTYEEIEAVLATGEPSGALAAAVKAKTLLSDVFPGARIDKITEDEAAKCSICGEPLGTVTMMFESGSEACAPCWTRITGGMPEHLRAMNSPTEPKQTRRKSGAELDLGEPKAKR